MYLYLFCHGFVFHIIILKIMQLAHIDEHEQLASHVTPGHALSVGQPPFFLSRDAINFASLDYLVGLTGKVRVRSLYITCFTLDYSTSLIML